MKKKIVILFSTAIILILIGVGFSVLKEKNSKVDTPNDNPPSVEEKKTLTKEQALALLNEKAPLESGMYQFVEETQEKYYRFEIVLEDGSVDDSLTYLVDKLEHLVYKENSYIESNSDFDL